MKTRWVIWMTLGILGTSFPEFAATVLDGFADVTVSSNLVNPTAMTLAPDGRLFVCQQGGEVRVIKNDMLLAEPFLTVSTDAMGERGLLGITLHPGFSVNGFLYVYYTATIPSPHNRVSRFTAAGDVALAGSEVVILELDPLTDTRHNGGAIHFGPGGLLYVGVGDNTTSASAQSLDSRFGKILCVADDGTIPTTNPFYNEATGANRAIWALGLRNPFTFAFNPDSDRMLINDVGADRTEEINEGVYGQNYGWPICEGSCASFDPGLMDPIFEYAHGVSLTAGRAITGGAFYSPATRQFPASYQGGYFFADFLAGWIRILDPFTGYATAFAWDIAGPVDLKVSADGSLYYLSRSTSGSVHRISYLNGAPTIRITRAGPDIIVHWPTVFTDYRLEATDTPGEGATWTTVQGTVSVVNEEFQVVLDASGDQQLFFRLVKP